MRIAYVSLHWPRTHKESVGRKIFEQLYAWQARGHTTMLFMHTSVHEPQSDLIPGSYYNYRSHKSKLGLIPTEYERIHAMNQLIEALRLYQPELIYLRYGIFVYPVHRITTLAPTIEEINTNDVTQHKNLGATYDLYNRYTRGILLRRVSGLVCVSHELAQAIEFRKYHRSTVVISNGIDLSSIPAAPAPRNKTPKVIFIATPGYSWHGVDKIVKLAKRFADLQIIIIGYDETALTGNKPDNLSCLGYLEPPDYKKIIEEADLGLGTLALHRKSMNEASPLKTRECLAYGLPMVLPYKDTDLDNLECDFLLKIPNREDNVDTHGEAIHDFAYNMCGKRADRSMLLPRIDSMNKEKSRLEFFHKIASSQH
jgi:glycosyltransferase involved in cell wall biosynthesis